MSLAAEIRTAALAPQANEVVLTFLTITHPDITTMYLVNNTVAVTRSGQSYAPLGAVAILPPEQNGKDGNARLELDAVDLTVIDNLRTAAPEKGPLLVAIAIALASTPSGGDSYGVFEWRPVSFDGLRASGDLVDGDLDILVPGDVLSPINNPGGF